MDELDANLLRGTLELLILKALSWGPQHGYGIAEWIGGRTGEAVMIGEGTLYPALHRLEGNASVRVLSAEPLAALIRGYMSQDRLVARVVTCFGAFTLGLAALGLYAVMTFRSIRRTSEFGLRIALGARPTSVRAMVLHEALQLVAAGALIGLPLALAVRACCATVARTEPRRGSGRPASLALPWVQPAGNGTMAEPRARPTFARISVLLSAMLVAPLHSDAAAQTPMRLDPGARLRVSLENARRSIVADLVEVKPDTLVLGRTHGTVESTIPFPVTHIRKLEVWAGKGASLAPVGAISGMLLGAALVAGYNSIVFSQCFSSCPEGRTSPWIGLGVGGVIGGLSLHFVRPDRWVEIAVPVGKTPAESSR